MPGKKWTDEEIEFLELHYCHMSNKDIAKALGRSTNNNGRCIQRKAQELGMGCAKEYVSAIPIAELPDLIGVDYRTIYGVWIQKNKMKTRKVNYHLRVVTENNLCKFMKEHPHLWNARKCDEYFFWKNDWFRKKWESDKFNKQPKKWNAWTKEEDMTLLTMRKRGYTFKEIENQINRNRHSCRSRFVRLTERKAV